jgi:hypothetical protein
MRFASNRNASGEEAYQQGSGEPLFLPAHEALSEWDAAVLDTGNAMTPEGMWGPQPFLGDSVAGGKKVKNPGCEYTVTAPDTPRRMLPKKQFNPNYANYDLDSFGWKIVFKAFLVAVTVRDYRATDPASRLYSVLGTVDWKIEGEWTYDPVKDKAKATPSKPVTLVGQEAFDAAKPAIQTDLEVEGPTFLSSKCWDARHDPQGMG